jgi:hypothetical protein
MTTISITLKNKLKKGKNELGKNKLMGMATQTNKVMAKFICQEDFLFGAQFKKK